MSPDEVEQIIAYDRFVAAQYGHVLTLLDVSEMGDVPVSTRKMVRLATDLPLRGIAVHGASFQARLIIRMVLMAYQLFAEDRDNPLAFFAGEGGARSWLQVRHARVVRAA
ncbi:hypothetical protein [Chondromyces crocatus]|uniref:hypothetical protein n=1 Tax=Chondromyces crocatus TaxID=52 RepID=UPI001C54CD06|nr:hypothetical protein [Chondromyces crocatus]